MRPSFYEASDIDAAYLTPLRSVLLIDDQFPRYEELLDGIPSEAMGSFDTDTAKRLLEEFRQRDLMCDVENRASELSHDRMRHLGKSDLVVLDYHLDRRNENDPDKALRIIRHLAESPNANLVVVYTNANDLDNVRREIAVYLRGMPAMPKLSVDHEEVLNTWTPEIPKAVIDLYIKQDDDWKRRVGGLRTELTRREVPPREQTELIRTVLDRFIADNYPGAADRPFSPVELSDSDQDVLWVHCENVFVAVAGKGGGVSPVEYLRRCILSWNPPALQILLAHARNHLEQGGFRYERDVLGDFELHVGWIYQALYGSEGPDKQVRLLLDRLFSGLQKQLAESVTPTARSIVEKLSSIQIDLKDKDAIQAQQALIFRAGQIAGVPEGIQPTQILHTLNAYLCGEVHTGAHLRPGTIFCSVINRESKEWFVCVAPACEMVPREPAPGSWKHDLRPLFPVDVLRLEPETDHLGPLKRATNCRHLFLKDGDRRLTLRLADEATRQSRRETLLVADQGRIRENSFTAYRVLGPLPANADDNASPQIDRLSCIAVAQLRPSYTDRILQETGFQGARVGVDFSNLA